MKVADLVKKKNQRVTVRVPARLKEKLGDEVSGTIVRVKAGGSVASVVVKVARRGEFTFRPQDLTAA